MSARRILITNLKLTARSGTEIHLRDLALELTRRGHRLAVYAPVAGGGIADDLRRAGVPVVSRLDDVGFVPDLIHGHHAHQTMAALLHFSAVPGIFVCHDARAWHDDPPHFPRIRRYVPVDETCRERVAGAGIAESRVQVVLNSVDLERFRPRDPLPPYPRRALVFSHLARSGSVLDAIAESCRLHGIALDVVGAESGRLLDRPEEILGGYDLVFAKAKAAMEALAVGTAVILCDQMGLGALVTTGEFEVQRRRNFGRWLLSRPVTVRAVSDEIARYDALDAAAVSERLRACAGLETTVDALLTLYEDVLREHAEAGPIDAATERNAVAAFLERVASTETLIDAENFRRQNEALRDEHLGLSREIERRSAEVARLSQENETLSQANDRLRRAQEAAMRRPLASRLLELLTGQSPTGGDTTSRPTR